MMLVNIEPVRNISDLTRSLIFTTEKLTELVITVDHKELQNTLKGMTMKLQNQLYDLNYFCFEILNNDQNDIVSVITNCS
jgi:hypothetical protein